MDALLLARMQFAANITFHILFPTISIGMGWLLLFFRLRWLKTRHGADRAVAQGWLDAYRFWTKVFALSFALGVVSGITMSFHFGTNWPGFMEHVGNVAGPLLGYEVLTAFFLAAGFFVGSADSPDSVLSIRFGFGVSSSSADFFVPDLALLFGAGDSSDSGVGLFPAAGAVGFGFGVGSFLDLALRFAGFGFAVGSGVSVGVGDAIARISSRALMRASCLFFSSSVNCALTKVATIALSARAVPRKRRKRITAGERNRAEGAIKRAVALPQHWQHAPAPGGESHSIFRPAIKANRSGTSRSSAR